MRSNILVLTAALVLSVLTGCQPSVSRQYLVVGFQTGEELRYRFISERDTTLSIVSAETATKKGKSQQQKMTEKMDVVMSYTPMSEDEYGRTVIRAKCLSAAVSRQDFGGKAGSKDAVDSLSGRSFDFTVSATGEVEDNSQLDALVKDIAKDAFGAPRAGRKVKNPDMIDDFISMQYHLWDSVATIKNPRKGVNVGQQWKTIQMMPVSMPMKMFRETTYTLKGVEQTESGPMAIIGSTYQKSDYPAEGVPVPYGEDYMPKGMFVILTGYRMTSFEGGGSQRFDIDRGVVVDDQQSYNMKFNVSFPLPLGDSQPELMLDQKMSIELLKE